MCKSFHFPFTNMFNSSITLVLFFNKVYNDNLRNPEIERGTKKPNNRRIRVLNVNYLVKQISINVSLQN